METIKELENKINDVEETLNNLKAKVEELKKNKNNFEPTSNDWKPKKKTRKLNNGLTELKALRIVLKIFLKKNYSISFLGKMKNLQILKNF